MVAGLLLCIAWYYTIISGFFILYSPVMYLMFFNHKWYRKIVDMLFALWELYPVALFQCCCGTELHHLGDYVNPDEKTIIVLNHRTRIDWNYVWIALYHATQDPTASDKCICKESTGNIRETKNFLDLGGKSKLKFVLKDEIKAVPCLGWIMQLNFFPYVKRNWREDQLNLSQFIDYYKRIGCVFRLVLFPEGTDLSEENKRRSEKYAAVNQLPCYEYVMHPRTTGWAALCSQMQDDGLASVYDVTVAYDTPAQTETDLLRGIIPANVYFYFKRYPIQKIPREEMALKSWLSDRWCEKELSLRNFHKKGNFIDPTSKKAPSYQQPRTMLLAKIGFIFWSLIDLLFTYAILNSMLFQFWVIYHSFLFVFVTWYFGGFQNVQYKLIEKLHL